MMKKVILFLVMSLLLAIPVFADAASKTVVQVTGSSQKEVTPDIARINLAVNSINGDLEKAKAENTQTVNRVLAALKAEGVTDKELNTGTYQISPLYNYENDKLPVLKGYRVTEGLDIRTPIDKVGILVNALTKAGANEINSIRFETANETEIKNEALQEAVRDALRKAEVLAGAVNKRVANVTLINESGVFYNPVMLESRMLKTAVMDGAAPNIPAGKVTVGANVQVTVELE